MTRETIKEQANKSIKGWYTSDQDINHKYPYKESDLLDKEITFIFPLRDPLARKKSAMLQQIHACFICFVFTCTLGNNITSM